MCKNREECILYFDMFKKKFIEKYVYNQYIEREHNGYPMFTIGIPDANHEEGIIYMTCDVDSDSASLNINYDDEKNSTINKKREIDDL